MSRKTISVLLFMVLTLIFAFVTLALWSTHESTAKITGVLAALCLLAFAGIAITTRRS